VTPADIGEFRLSATRDGNESPEECTPPRVRAAQLCFRSDPQIKKSLKHVKFERDKQ
jgi:hypothetical protein